MRPKDIGTRYETAVVRYLRDNGFPHAERRALAGTLDLGDITGTPGVMWECKAGKAAYTASDGQVVSWLAETERQRVNAKADIGVLITDRSSYGPARVGETWATVRADGLLTATPGLVVAGARPVRMHLATLVLALRFAGYGQPLDRKGALTT